MMIWDRGYLKNQWGKRVRRKTYERWREIPGGTHTHTHPHTHTHTSVSSLQAELIRATCLPELATNSRMVSRWLSVARITSSPRLHSSSWKNRDYSSLAATGSQIVLLDKIKNVHCILCQLAGHRQSAT